MTLTKADIIEQIYRQTSWCSKQEAADLVDMTFESMKKTLERGEKVKIHGFGVFSTRDKRERTGRNPQTGEVITISARRVVGWKASEKLKGKMDRPGTPPQAP